MGEEQAPLDVRWLGRVDYREAWQMQHDLVAARARRRDPGPAAAAGAPTCPDARPHGLTRATFAPRQDELAQRGIEVIRVERGGEVTYHGPGQLVAYPIIHLAERGVLLRPLVRALEQSMIDTAAGYGVSCRPTRRAPRCLVRPGR